MSEQNSTQDSLENKAAELLRLHEDPTLLTVVNVWDAISAKVVAETPGTAALATASHAVAASLGYPDGEKIPVDLMIEAVGRIVEATTLPVSADLEAGYGDPAETVRKAIGVGVVGANVEDQMKPLDEAVRDVEAIMDAAISEGVPDFVLNARTDASCSVATATRPACWPRPSSAARPTWRPAHRRSSCPGCSARNRSPRWSRPSVPSG